MLSLTQLLSDPPYPSKLTSFFPLSLENKQAKKKKKEKKRWGGREEKQSKEEGEEKDTYKPTKTQNQKP